MAEVAVLAGSGWVVSPIMRKIINDAKTYLGKDMAQELDDLETTVIPQFRFVIKAAERSPRQMELERWLWKLKAAFYDAEDLLDMHEYKLLQRKATGNISMSSTSNSRLALASAASNLLPANRRLLRKLTELKNILVEAKNFHRGVPFSRDYCSSHHRASCQQQQQYHHHIASHFKSIWS